MTCFAPQVDVNRPVEDRWSAYRVGGAIGFEAGSPFDAAHPLHAHKEAFPGGHWFSVVDGHGGHTCAHAVNLMMADYITCSLLPTTLLQPLLESIESPDCDGDAALLNWQGSGLAQTYLVDRATYATGVMETDAEQQM